MKTKKRGFVVGVTVLTLAVLLLVSFTLAYLTDSRNTLNVLGIGAGRDSSGNVIDTVKIELDEPGFKQVAETKTDDDGNEYYELMNVLPGISVDKDPTISNVGAGEVWVRVRLENEAGTELKLNESPLSVFNASVDTSKWIYIDGYYYYFEKLAVGATGIKFFEEQAGGGTLKIDEKTGNSAFESLPEVLNMNVIAEAVQGDGFTPNYAGTTNPWVHSDNTPIVPETAIVRS